MTLNDTTRGNRLHIGLFGRRNAGKSSLINALTGQSVATVSAVPGTTTDPVYKAMELHGIGPVVFIDWGVCGWRRRSRRHGRRISLCCYSVDWIWQRS